MTVAGAVLTGGASSRMGRTKATLDVDGRAMGDRVIDALRDSGIGSVVVVGGDEHELARLDAPFVADRFPGEGPVGGVITALESASSTSGAVDAVLVVSCDLVALDPETVSALTGARVNRPGHDVWVAVGDRLEPMCALWSIACLGRIRRAFDGGRRALHRVIAELDHDHVEVEPAALLNVNRPDDLTGFTPDR